MSKPDRAIVLERIVEGRGLTWTCYDVVRGRPKADGKREIGEVLSPSPCQHKSKALAWAADWNRKNVPKVAELKAAQRRVAAIERFVKPLDSGRGTELNRLYGDEFCEKLCKAHVLLRDCREIILEAEKKEAEACQTPETT